MKTKEFKRLLATANTSDNLPSYDEINEMTNRQINKFFRLNDDSYKWPICGRFNATERAIRKVNEIMRFNGAFYGIEYYSAIENFIGIIVNKED